MTGAADSADKLTHDDKLNLLDNLSMVLSRTTYLKIWCEQHNNANAGALEQRHLTLSAAYDKLSAALWNDWIGAAKPVNASMTSATSAVLKSVDNVKADVATVENVAQAIGLIDGVIQIAGALRP
jgi:hypothetical protein